MLEIDFNFINSQSVILIVKGIAAGIGDDTSRYCKRKELMQNIQQARNI